MKKINETFICINCGKKVPAADKTCRNHCPYCFTSLHVDDKIPGDRKSTCLGIMYPIAYEYKNGPIKITFKCSKCGHIHHNKSASDDDIGTIVNAIQKNYNPNN